MARNYEIERLIRTNGKSDHYDPKWGFFKPTERFNVDQTPVPFTVNTKRVYEAIEPGQKHSKTWIRQAGSGLDKRQCTVQVGSRADGNQPRIAVIFRGKGARLTQLKRRIIQVLMFIDNAWEDTKFSVEWVTKTQLLQ